VSIKQTQLLELVHNRQSELKLTDSQLINNVMPYNRWWRIKTKNATITYEEAIRLLNNLNFEVKVIIPEVSVKL
jgi:aspartyl/asparaginyl-tRNA synthetase